MLMDETIPVVEKWLAEATGNKIINISQKDQ